MLKAAEWYSHHTGKPMIVLSDRLAEVLGAGDDDHDLTNALQDLSLATATEQAKQPECALARAHLELRPLSMTIASKMLQILCIM